MQGLNLNTSIHITMKCLFELYFLNNQKQNKETIVLTLIAQHMHSNSQAHVLGEEVIFMSLPRDDCFSSTVTEDKEAHCACCRKHPPLFTQVIPAVNSHLTFRNNFLCQDTNEGETPRATPTSPLLQQSPANYLSTPNWQVKMCDGCLSGWVAWRGGPARVNALHSFDL